MKLEVLKSIGRKIKFHARFERVFIFIAGSSASMLLLLVYLQGLGYDAMNGIVWNGSGMILSAFMVYITRRAQQRLYETIVERAEREPIY